MYGYLFCRMIERTVMSKCDTSQINSLLFYIVIKNFPLFQVNNRALLEHQMMKVAKNFLTVCLEIVIMSRSCSKLMYSSTLRCMLNFRQLQYVFGDAKPLISLCVKNQGPNQSRKNGNFLAMQKPGSDYCWMISRIIY